MKKAMCTLLLLATMPLFGAVSPYYQSVREIEGILRDQRFVELVGQNASIQSITRDEESYMIITTSKAVRVDLILQNGNAIGPRNYDFHFEVMDES